MPVSTVLLDAGGVIVDESPQEARHAEIVSRLLSDCVPGYSQRTYWQDMEEAVASYCPSVYQFILWKHLKPDREVFERLRGRHRELYLATCPPLVPHADLEPELRVISQRFKIGIAGQYGGELLDTLGQYSLLDFFSWRLTQDDFDLTKPDPRYFEQIIGAMGIEAGECIMVGDRIDKDIIPARQLGMRTILVRMGIHKHQQPRIPAEAADLELDGIKGLADAVRRIAGTTG